MNRSTHFFTILAATVVAVFVSTQLNWVRSLTGVPVNFLPGLIVYTALRTRPTGLFAVGLVAGLLSDSVSANPMGASIMPLLTTGALVQMRKEWLLSTQVFAQFILGLLAGALIPLIDIAMVFMMAPESTSPPVVGAGFLWQWFVHAIVSGLLSPLVFGLLDGIQSSLTPKATPMTRRRDRFKLAGDSNP